MIISQERDRWTTEVGESRRIFLFPRQPQTLFSERGAPQLSKPTGSGTFYPISKACHKKGKNPAAYPPLPPGAFVESSRIP